VATEAASAAAPTLGRVGRAPPPDRLWTAALVATLVLASLLPLFGFVAWRVHDATMRSTLDTKTELERRAAALSAAVDAEMRQQLLLLHAMAALPEFDPLDRAGAHGRVKRMAAVVPQW
jgi:hypothetical protein